ncbi:MAG: HD domain-containing protein [Candidatus Lambdaproteobacteria bacterium]|nr:HD domain-containing protein [Candidatus Lambdaproteobacteria bacterium]
MLSESRAGLALDMPALYFERTTPEEQARHAARLRQLPAGGWSMLLEGVALGEQAAAIEIVTTDWEEPGLLDRIFEAILHCVNVPEGVAIGRARIFTGNQGQVVNTFELLDRRGRPLQPERTGLVIEQLRKVQPGERGVLQTIERFPYTSLIPLVTDFPSIDNGRSEQFTYLELKVSNLSNRFTSVLLHTLARSLWLNIKLAEFRQEQEGRYAFWVVNQRGEKLRDSHFNRRNLVQALETMNDLLLRFNLNYVRREWYRRIDANERTIYHSRPDPKALLADMQNLRQLLKIKGFDDRLSAVVDAGLLDHRSYYFLKKAETFVEHNQGRFQAALESSPDADAIESFREYFEYRRRALRILEPLFERLLRVPAHRPPLTDEKRLHALAKPFPQSRYALDPQMQLYISGSIWLEDPELVFDPFLLGARTGCFLRMDTKEAIEAVLEGWTDFFMEEHRDALGKKFLAVLDEGLRQGTAAIVLRNMRALGLLQRYIPGFPHIQGLVHVIQDHQYTVDEHTFVLIEALESLKLLRHALPTAGKSSMRQDYERTKDAVGLRKFALKYAAELRMLQNVTQLRGHPSVKPFFQLMDEVRGGSLEYLVEMNLLDYGYSTCMDALVEIENTRRRLDTLSEAFSRMPFAEQRVMVLAALFHDISKPALDHDVQGAAILEDLLRRMGLRLSRTERQRIVWLVRHHLDLRDLINLMGSQGDEAITNYARQAGDPTLLRALVVFTYADRVAVRLDSAKNAHDALLLSQMLSILDGREAGVSRLPG